MKILIFNLVFSFFSYEILAQNVGKIGFPPIPHLETYKCSDNVERVYMYLKEEMTHETVHDSSETSKNVKGAFKATVAKVLEGNLITHTLTLAPWNRFTRTFAQKETETENLYGILSDSLKKSITIKPGATYEGTFQEHIRKKGETKTLLKVWQVKRTVGAAQKASSNGGKITVYPLTEISTHGKNPAVKFSALYAPSLRTVIEFTTDEGGKSVTCNLISYTKKK